MQIWEFQNRYQSSRALPHVLILTVGLESTIFWECAGFKSIGRIYLWDLVGIKIQYDGSDGGTFGTGTLEMEIPEESMEWVESSKITSTRLVMRIWEFQKKLRRFFMVALGVKFSNQVRHGSLEWD